MKKEKTKKPEKEQKQKKQRKPAYEPIEGVLGEACDYHVYDMKIQDRIAAGCIATVIGMVVVFVFFRILPAAAAAGIILIFPAQNLYRNYKIKKRQKELLLQFKDLLESLATSYSSGQNTQGAFGDAKADMVSIYGEKADITAEVELIANGIANNITPETLLSNFAARSGLEDVEIFANVFEVVNRQGSNLKDVISDSREIINDKIEIEMEIETMLQGNKNELNIMIVMPLVIVASVSGLGTMTIANNTPFNVVLKLICIGVFGAAYFMGRKIVDIKL